MNRLSTKKQFRNISAPNVNNRKPHPNYPGFDKGINGFALEMKMQKGAEWFGVQNEYADVTSVNFSERLKVLERSITAHK